MKKFTQILILSIFTILMIGGFTKSAFADAPLIVHFQNEPQPLFNEANFAPGNEITRTVEVANNSESSQNIIVEAINGVNTGGLGDKLNLVITEDGVQTPKYTGTLGAFLSVGEVLLSPLSSGTNTTYSFGITFDNNADDTLQNKTLGFDLCVGFQGGTMHCGGTVISEENGGNTGGSTISGSSGSMPITLVISNEQALNITNVGQTGSATITWDTNKLATSQVIYGPIIAPYNLDISVLPNLGYPLGSVEDGNKVMNHSVILTGLIPGQTYVYRVVSHASPATVSYEHQFTVPLLAQGDNNNNTILNNNPNNNNLNTTNGQVLGAQINPLANPLALGTNNNGGLDTTQNAGNLNNNGDNLLGASAGNIIGLPNLSFWALLVVILLLIFLIIKIYRKRKNK